MTDAGRERIPSPLDGGAWRRIWGLVPIFALSALAGLIFQAVGAPLPWMIGPLVVTALAYGSGIVATPVPTRVRPIGQMIVALQVGLYFSPLALEAVWSSTPLLLALALLTAAWSLFVSCILARLTGLPFLTSFIATMPTSPVEATVLADRIGVERLPVVLSQTIRTAAVVLLVPMTLYALNSWPAVPASIATFRTPSILDTLLLAGSGLLGATAFRLTRIPNPNFLGPLAISATLTGIGMEIAPMPAPVLAMAQIVLGTWLGSVFRRDLLGRSGWLAMACLFNSLLLLILVCGSAALLAPVIGYDPVVLVLGAAPGGVTEMALTARYLGQDVALITAFQLTRIFLIMPNLPWLIALLNTGESQNTPTEKD